MRHVVYIGGPMDGMRGAFDCSPPSRKRFLAPGYVQHEWHARDRSLVSYAVYELVAVARYEYAGIEQGRPRRRPSNWKRSAAVRAELGIPRWE